MHPGIWACLLYTSAYPAGPPGFSPTKAQNTDYLLTSKRICDYMDLYMSCPEDLRNPYFAPLLAQSLADQPDTLVIPAAYDTLRDEGEELSLIHI